VFTEALGLHYLVSKIVAATLIFGWNFAARKLLLFREPRTGPGPRPRSPS
jgi:hypothetical protein